MKLILAPMEGVIDHHMRKALTSVGGYDACVTEFVRIVDLCLPDKVFNRISPELAQQGRTSSGIPVILQLLGGNPEAMAASAQRAVELGAPAIDINFGCPSKMVTRKMGGSVLLKEPGQVHDIVAAVRKAVDASIPVTAKMRLGYENDALALDNALAIEAAGAAELVVHARTKVEGYKPPARWEALAPLREALTIPLIANGDITSLQNYHRCFEASGCESVMLGRGALNNPSLAKQIKQSSHNEAIEPMNWRAISSLILATSEKMELDYPQEHIVRRHKQWLAMLRAAHPAGQRVFHEIRRMTVLADIKSELREEENRG